LSHDEVVYGKHSLIGKMPGDHWQKFANLRAYFGFMWGHPGKKLLFMGSEIAQWPEWNHDAEIDWATLGNSAHSGVQRLVRDLNRVYCAEPALHERDAEGGGFRWVVGDDRSTSVFAFLRFGAGGSQPILVICNLALVPRHDYRVGVPRAGRWREIVNTDSAFYGGSNVGNEGGVQAVGYAAHEEAQSIVATLPPLATVMLRSED
jgi:1,4-alpha-glucan branching enzyme